MPGPKKANVRLPGHIRPERYKVSLKPDLDAFTFTGEEEIKLAVSQATKSITLHSAELEIFSAEYNAGKETFTGKVSYNDKDELAIITFPKAVPKGKGTLKMTFAGILNDKMRGFYRSRYEHDGQTYHMGVTQFESTDARRAFPCFDEPAHKAIFDVTLIVPKDRTVISNTIETGIAEHEGGYKAVSFAPSPKMSSYLLAFIVGHFEHIQDKTKNGTLVRVYTTPGKNHQAEFALEVTVKCIEFYEKYFGIRYPLPTMDLIAIPDFASGAMENWGAVTYRETAVLFDPKDSSAQNKQRVALVIAHELAHQWFGNLVTMEWWTHLWLNEGFATYMEYVAIDAVYPKWNIWSHFVSMEHSRALALDALINTHAIEIDVHHPSEISEIFDAVSYSKGASVIRMLAHYIGESAFRKGLQGYLTRHQYGNALTKDLWRALEKTSGKPVGKVMENWTRKPGYPLITVEEEKRGIAISQKRFFPDKNHKDGEKTLWLTPLTTGYGKNKTKDILLKARSMNLPLSSPTFIKVNLGEKSFARVRYSHTTLMHLAEEIGRKNNTLSEADRFGVIRDAFALAKSGVSGTDEALRLALAYKNETSYIVWSEIVSHLFTLRNLLFGTPLFESFAIYAQTLLVPAAKKIGWKRKKNESADHPFLRNTLLYAAGTFGDKETVASAQKLFMKGNVNPDIRGAVYNIVAQNGGKKEFAALMSMYKKATLEEEKDRILRALCSFKSKIFLGAMLDFAFSKESRGQDTLKAVTFVFMNPYGRAVAWVHLKKNWKEIQRRFGGGHLFSRFISPASNFTSAKEAGDIQAFFKKHSSPGIDRTVRQAVEQITSHAAWYKRDQMKLGRFLKSHNN